MGLKFLRGNTVVKNERTFADVPADYFAKKDIETLAAKFVISGYEDGTFHHERFITRAELAGLLIRALGILPETTGVGSFQDIQPTDWYAGAITAAVRANLVDGYGNNTFAPNQHITRQEMAVMIVNALNAAGYAPLQATEAEQSQLDSYQDKGQIAVWAKDAAAIAIKEGIILGTSDEIFSPNEAMNRGQAAAIIYRMMLTLGFTN